MRSRCCLCIPLWLLGNGSVKNPPIVVRQLLGKNPLIVARQWCDKSPPIVARQLLGKNPPIVARQRLERIHEQQQKNCWTRRFQCAPCRIKGK
jgi:hypothetical protein